jgi:hypothetical protein
MSATEGVQSAVLEGNIPDEATLTVAVQAINVATEVGSVGRADRAARLANLARLIADAGRTIGGPREFRPEVAAQQCLDLLPAPDARDELTIGDWRKLPVEKIRGLRRVNDQLTPLLGLSPYIGDARLSEDIAQWMAVYPQLP